MILRDIEGDNVTEEIKKWIEERKIKSKMILVKQLKS